MTEKLKYVSLRFQTQIIDEKSTMGAVSDYAYVYMVMEDGKKYFGEKYNNSSYNYVLYSIEYDGDIPSSLSDINFVRNVDYEEILRRKDETVYFTYLDGDMSMSPYDVGNREAILKIGTTHGNVKDNSFVSIKQRLESEEVFDLFSEYFVED